MEGGQNSRFWLLLAVSLSDLELGKPPAQRGIKVDVVVAHPDGPRLADLLARGASGELTARVRAVVPLDQAADAHRAMAKGGLRGRCVLKR